MPAEMDAPEADLREYGRLLWRRKWLIALVTVVGVGAAIGVSQIQPVEYTASAQVLLQPQTTTAALASGSGANLSLSPTDVATQVQIATSAPVKQAVAHDLNQTYADVAAAKVSEVGTTNVISVQATDRSASRAATVANDYAKEYLNFRRQQDSSAFLAAAAQMQTRIDALNGQIAKSGGSSSSAANSALAAELATYQGQLEQLQADASLSSGDAELVTPATAPTSPSSPRPKLDALLGLVVGLALGVGAAFLLETLDDRIRDPAVLEAATGLPLLGVVPRLPKATKGHEAEIVSVSHPASGATESFRQLRTALQFANLERRAQVIQITSPSSGEGKSTTAVNLAVAMANAGERVLLVDADLRRPRIHQFFGLDHDSGLTSVLLGQTSLEDAVTSTEIEGLRVLTSGVIPPNPAELLAGERFAKLVSRMLETASVLVLDGPPVLPVADAIGLAARTQAVVMVTRAERTHQKSVLRSLELLGQVGASVVGLVFNAVPVPRRAGYRYGGYYGYYGGQPYRARQPEWQEAAGHGNGNGHVPVPVPVEVDITESVHGGPH